jgi:hypothetical protein
VNEAEDYASFILGLLFTITVTLTYWYFRVRRASRREGTFRRVARVLRGTVGVGDTLEPMALQFSIEGRPAMIEFEEVGVPSTRVKVAMFRRSPGVCRILANHVAREQLKFIGARDIRIGDGKFDAQWFVTARPESLAHRIFAEDRRAQVIESVRRLARIGVPSIEISRDSLVVRIDRVLERDDDLKVLAQTAIDFVGYILRLGPEEGIAWVAAGEAEVGLCPVCAAEMTDGVILCEKCHTPHHEECWTYVGQCSTYACKGKRFVEGPVSGHDRGAAAS